MRRRFHLQVRTQSRHLDLRCAQDCRKEAQRHLPRVLVSCASSAPLSFALADHLVIADLSTNGASLGPPLAAFRPRGATGSRAVGAGGSSSRRCLRRRRCRPPSRRRHRYVPPLHPDLANPPPQSSSSTSKTTSSPSPPPPLPNPSSTRPPSALPLLPSPAPHRAHTPSPCPLPSPPSPSVAPREGSNPPGNLASSSLLLSKVVERVYPLSWGVRLGSDRGLSERLLGWRGRGGVGVVGLRDWGGRTRGRRWRLRWSGRGLRGS